MTMLCWKSVLEKSNRAMWSVTMSEQRGNAEAYLSRGTASATESTRVLIRVSVSVQIETMFCGMYTCIAFKQPCTHCST